MFGGQETTGHSTQCHGLVNKVVISLIGLDDVTGSFHQFLQKGKDMGQFVSVL